MKRFDSLSPDEVLEVLKVARDKSNRKHAMRNHAMILLAYVHGLRASEVCGLRLENIDMANGSLTVARLKGSMLTVQKLHRSLKHPLLDEPSVLRDWLDSRPHVDSDFLFISQKGGKLCRSAFFRAFQSISKNAGMPDEVRHPHVLKHSIATHMVDANANLADVKQSVGHRSITSTMRYVSRSRVSKSDAARNAALDATFQ